MNQHDSPLGIWLISQTMAPGNIVLVVKGDAHGAPHAWVSLRAQDSPIAEGSATTPVMADMNAQRFPVRPSFRAVKLKLNPARPVKQYATSYCQFRQVADDGIAVVDVSKHDGSQRAHYHADGGNDLPEIGVHQPGLLRTQEDAGRLLAAAAQRTEPILTGLSGIDIDEYRRPAPAAVEGGIG